MTDVNVVLAGGGSAGHVNPLLATAHALVKRGASVRALGTREGLLGGVNAVIVGNYLTTLGRDADEDINLLAELNMPIRELQKTL